MQTVGLQQTEYVLINYVRKISQNYLEYLKAV